MKTLKLIGMALIAIVMSMNFTSCSSDDEEELIKNDDGVIINQKNLWKLRGVYENGESTINEYTYDNNGKLLSATKTDLYGSNKDISTHAFTWGANKIIENRNGKVFIYTLKDELITHRDYNVAFTYNSNKQLIQHNEEGEDDHYTWQGEKLVQMTSIDRYDDEDIYELSYSGKTCKGYLPIMVWYVMDDYLSLLMEAHPELVGMRRNQLPDQIYHKDKYGEDIRNCSYTFDKDGYVESCTIVYKDLSDADTYTTIYTFKWE